MLSTDSGLEPGTSQVQTHTAKRKEKRQEVKPNSDRNNRETNGGKETKKAPLKKKSINLTEANGNGVDWMHVWNLYTDFIHSPPTNSLDSQPIAPTRKRRRRLIKKTSKAAIPNQTLTISAINQNEKLCSPLYPQHGHTGCKSTTPASSTRAAESKSKTKHDAENQQSNDAKRKGWYSRKTRGNQKLRSSKPATNLEIETTKTSVNSSKNRPSKTISDCIVPKQNITLSAIKQKESKELENTTSVSTTRAVKSRVKKKQSNNAKRKGWYSRKTRGKLGSSKPATNLEIETTKTSVNSSKNRPSKTISDCIVPKQNITLSAIKQKESKELENTTSVSTTRAVKSRVKKKQSKNAKRRLSADSRKTPGNDNQNSKPSNFRAASDFELLDIIQIILQSTSNCNDISRVKQKSKRSRKRSVPKSLQFKTGNSPAAMSSTVDRNNKHSQVLKKAGVSHKMSTISWNHLWNLYLDFVPIKKNVSSGGIARKICANSTQPADTCVTAAKADMTQLEYVAIDCEMVEIGGRFRKKKILARVSVVDQQCRVLLDKFVKPRGVVTDYRTQFSGIRPQDIENGENFDLVRKEVSQLIKNKIIVGHALHHDLYVLNITHPFQKTRDTSTYGPFRCYANGKTPSLKRLCEAILGYEIQSGEHSSVEDAQAAMEIYNSISSDWEKELKV